MIDVRRLHRTLHSLERLMRIKLIAYDEHDDEIIHGLDVLERLEAQDKAGNPAPNTESAIRLTADQVEKLASTEERIGLSLVALDPKADVVVFGDRLIRRLVEEYELED